MTMRTSSCSTPDICRKFTNQEVEATCVDIIVYVSSAAMYPPWRWGRTLFCAPGPTRACAAPAAAAQPRPSPEPRSPRPDTALHCHHHHQHTLYYHLAHSGHLVPPAGQLSRHQLRVCSVELVTCLANSPVLISSHNNIIIYPLTIFFLL